MNQSAGDWPIIESQSSLLSVLPVALEESRRRMVLIAAIFALLALSTLALGIALPKRYSATTSILVEQSNIIGPLMEGRAVPTGVVNRAGIARQVAFSRKVMNEILEAGGWLAEQPSALERDKLSERISDRTDISNPRPNLIQITYTDPDPKRAFVVTEKFAELVINESLATKERESRDAYEFIDSQVRQYHAKLTEAEANLERYRRENPDARPGIDADVNARIGELRRQIETSRMELVDLQSTEASLRSQLSGESEISMVQTRAGQFRARLAELQSERDRLLLNYTEQHPDVVRTQHQIADLQEDLRREDERAQTRLTDAPTVLDGSASYNPLYGELKSKLADVGSRSAAALSRIATGETMLAQEIERSGRIAASESSLAELTRDYEVNRDLYQDLLKRRENARVSMNLDAERRGLSFRIQEPATVPLRPSGLRLLHVASAGLLLAIATPLALLFGLIKFDPRVRSALRIEREAGLPLLGSVPSYRTRVQRSRTTRRIAMAAVLVATVPIAYFLVFTLKLTHTL
ncbi:MAG: hypothetical protein COW59_04430 [Lysobacterales bacterium CG17_big_fil_post_rev_8_21_14_2_50_64_11]|nr:MAG: hypothetical protein COW59_04430 [Xanthomonadales bacterium CG17_big_fil_post_rev_8_21_14_2_50_64_11]PIX61200.1 MAG: hypothetical protein COZ47_03195 [Xanthomonadales bacterium CG_4_10_14_3_um_filter_64_11]